MGSRFALNRYASGQNALFTMFIIDKVMSSYEQWTRLSEWWEDSSSK